MQTITNSRSCQCLFLEFACLISTDARPLEGRVAIVTGASSGIGKATVISLAKAGAKVAMAARRIEPMKEVQDQIILEGGIAIPVKTDVTKRDEVGISLNIIN